MRILSIDPSLLHCGWSILEARVAAGGVQLLNFGTIKAPSELKTEELVTRIRWILINLRDLEDEADRIVIEQPESWGAYKSLASSHSGSLLLLHLLTGAIVGWAAGEMDDPNAVVLVKVSKWKGQLPKQVTQKRMEQKHDVQFATNDEADAVGLGDWYLTQYLKEVNNGTEG